MPIVAITNRLRAAAPARLRSLLGAVLLIVAALGLMDRQQKLLSLDQFDQPFYLGIASDLIQTGRFTNGFMFDGTGPASGRPSGMRFSPLYPAMLAVAARLDPALRRGMACVVSTGDHATCPTAAPLMRWVQFCQLVGFYLLVWWIGGVVGGSPGMDWLTLALGLGGGPMLLRSAHLLMTEMTSLFLATAAIAAWLRGRRTGRGWAWAAASGALLGLTALTRPGYFYLLPFAVLGAGLLAAFRRGVWARAGALAAGGASTLAPWILRNWLVLGRAALTYGYDSHTLVQRIAFDTMTWREYGLAYLCWLPDGTSLGRRFFGPGACHRFGWDEQPDSFYSLGLRHMLDQTLAAAGGYEHHLGYLLHHYIFRMPLWHMAVSVPLALRGAYVGHWFGFVLLPVCLWWTVASLRAGRDAYLAVALPALFMLAFNASVAVNQTRYNLLLVPAYAAAGASSLRAIARRLHDAGWVGAFSEQLHRSG